MSNQPERPVKQRGRGKQLAGIVLFWIGIVLLVVGIIFIVVSLFSSGSSGMEEGLQIVAGLVALVAFVVSSIFCLIGITLYFVGRTRVKKVKNETSL